MRERERMERANRAAAWERRSGRRLHKSARRASFPAASKPGPAPRRGIGGGLRAGRAAAVRRATLPVLWRIGQDAMCSVCHCPPLASRPETQWARYGFTDRAAVSLRATLPVLRRTGRDAGAFPRQAIRGQRLAAGSAAACAQAVQLLSGAPPLPVLRSAQDAAAEPNEYALDCASDRKAYAWPPLPRTPHPRLTRWQRAFYHPFLWRTLCYGKRWIVRAGKRKDAGASARAA